MPPHVCTGQDRNPLTGVYHCKYATPCLFWTGSQPFNSSQSLWVCHPVSVLSRISTFQIESITVSMPPRVCTGQDRNCSTGVNHCKYATPCVYRTGSQPCNWGKLLEACHRMSVLGTTTADQLQSIVVSMPPRVCTGQDRNCSTGVYHCKYATPCMYWAGSQPFNWSQSL